MAKPRIWTLSAQSRLVDLGAHFRADGVCTNMLDEELEKALREELPEYICGGLCEPMCAWCNQQADLAAERRGFDA